MKIIYRVKRIGTKEPSIAEGNLNIGKIEEKPTLSEVLKAIANCKVSLFNRDRDQDLLMTSLMERDTGKVTFGRRYNRKKADHREAEERIIQAFEDGLFAVFCDDVQLQNLQDRVDLSRKPVFTFIRLTFLSGSVF